MHSNSGIAKRETKLNPIEVKGTVVIIVYIDVKHTYFTCHGPQGPMERPPDCPDLSCMFQAYYKKIKTHLNFGITKLCKAPTFLVSLGQF